MGDRTPAFPSDHGDLMVPRCGSPLHTKTQPRTQEQDAQAQTVEKGIAPSRSLPNQLCVGVLSSVLKLLPPPSPLASCGCGQRRGECEQRAARTSCVGVCVGLGACPACGPWSFRFPSCALWQWWATFGVSEGVAPCRWGTSNISESCAKSSPCSDKTNSIRSRSGESR